MSSGSIYSARYQNKTGKSSVVFKSSVDSRELTSTALLSYPERDLAGDIVLPEGIDFIRHMRSPGVDVEHRRDPGFGAATVGTAVNSSGEYRGRHVVLKCEDGTSRPLPVGTTHFDRNSKLQMQAFALVEREILPDVSLEFVPDMTCAKSLGKSPLEPRDAYEFGRVSVVRWTLCARGVCPSATVLKSVHDPLRSVLSAGRIGSEPLHETIKKALSHYLPSGKSTTVASGYVEKADMNEYGDTSAPVDTPADDSSPGATPTAQTAYDAAQTLTDVCERIKAGVKSSEHKAGKNKLVKLCDAIEGLVEKFMATGDQVAADVNGDEMDEDDEPEVEEEDTKPDDSDGVMKGMKKPQRLAYLKSLKRFTLAQVTKAEQPEDSDPAEAAELAKELELCRKERTRSRRERPIYT